MRTLRGKGKLGYEKMGGIKNYVMIDIMLV